MDKTVGGYSVDRLHDVFMGNIGKGTGKTVLFAFQLIGLAELDIFPYNRTSFPEDNVVWIQADRPWKWVEEIIHAIRKVCKDEGVEFVMCSGSGFRFAIWNTIFDFFIGPDTAGILQPSIMIGDCIDNDATYYPYEATDPKSWEKNLYYSMRGSMISNLGLGVQSK